MSINVSADIMTMTSITSAASGARCLELTHIGGRAAENRETGDASRRRDSVAA